MPAIGPDTVRRPPRQDSPASRWPAGRVLIAERAEMIAVADQHRDVSSYGHCTWPSLRREGDAPPTGTALANADTD